MARTKGPVGRIWDCNASQDLRAPDFGRSFKRRLLTFWPRGVPSANQAEAGSFPPTVAEQKATPARRDGPVGFSESPVGVLGIKRWWIVELEFRPLVANWRFPLRSPTRVSARQASASKNILLYSIVVCLAIIKVLVSIRAPVPVLFESWIHTRPNQARERQGEASRTGRMSWQVHDTGVQDLLNCLTTNLAGLV